MFRCERLASGLAVGPGEVVDAEGFQELRLVGSEVLWVGSCRWGLTSGSPGRSKMAHRV